MYTVVMKRDWLWIATVAALGEALGYLARSYIWIAIVISIIVAFVVILIRRDVRRGVIILLVAFLIGICRMGIDEVFYPRTEELDKAQNDSFECIIDDIEVREDMIVLTCGQVLIYEKSYNNNTIKYHIGNKINVRGDFSRPDEARNPGGFNYRLYYRSQGITHRCFADSIEITDVRKNVVADYFFGLRQKMLTYISEVFPPDDAAFVRAALLGDKTMLTDDLQDMYRRNGIAHLLAISGLHVSILGMGLYRYLRRFGLSLISAGTVAGVLMIIYGALTGFGVSTQRAVIMLIMIFFGGMIGRKSDLLNSAGVAAAVVMMINPCNIFSCGFMLSFGAVVGIGGPANTIMKRLGILAGNANALVARSLITSLSIQLVTLPVMAYFFFEIPLYAIFLNLIVIPLMTFVVLSGILSFIIPMFAGPGHYILCFYTWLCGICEKMPLHTILIGRPKWWQIVIYYLFLFAVLYLLPSVRKKRRLRFLMSDREMESS